jgi:ketosteroid isomerase-like protein
MSEESTTPDLVAMTRLAFGALDRGDFDAVMSFYAADAVADASVNALEVFEGKDAIRRFLEDWAGSFDDYAITVEEILDLGNGVVLAAYNMSGRPAGSEAFVKEGRCWIAVFVDGLVSAMTFYQHIDEARAAGERLAGERR